MNMKNESYKIEFISSLIQRIEVAIDSRRITNKLIADFIDYIPRQFQLVYLKELKQKGIVADFKIADDHFYIFKPSRSLLYQEKEEMSRAQPKPAEKAQKMSFNEKTGEIVWGDRKCQVPINTNQYFLCQKMFSLPFGEIVKEIDILDMIDWFKDSKRSVYDAMRAINEKARKEFGIKQLMSWRNNHVWINKDVL